MIARHYWKVGGANSAVNSCSRSSQAAGPSGLSIPPASTPSPSSRPGPAGHKLERGLETMPRTWTGGATAANRPQRQASEGMWVSRWLTANREVVRPALQNSEAGLDPARTSGSLAAGWRLLGLLRQQLGYQLLELAPGPDGNELAFLINEEHGRNRVDAPRSGEIALPAFALVVLGPPDFLLLDKLLDGVEPSLFLGLIEADAKELHALAVKLFVELLHRWQLGEAWAAPGCPEVDHHNLALEGAHRDGRSAGSIGELELERFADSLALAASAFDHGRELAVGIVLEYAVLERCLGLRITGRHGRYVNQAASTRVLGSELDECVDRGCIELAFPVLPVLEELRLGLEVGSFHLEPVILGVGQDVVDLLDQRIDLGNARRRACPPLGHERGNV